MDKWVGPFFRSPFCYNHHHHSASNSSSCCGCFLFTSSDYWCWNMEGIVDGIASNRVGEKERAAYFPSTFACVLTPSPPVFVCFSSFSTLDRRAAFNHGLHVRRPRWCKQFRNIAYSRAHTHTHTKTCDTPDAQCFIAVAPVSRVVSCENYGTYFNKMFQVNNKKWWCVASSKHNKKSLLYVLLFVGCTFFFSFFVVGGTSRCVCIW